MSHSCAVMQVQTCKSVSPQVELAGRGLRGPHCHTTLGSVRVEDF